MNVSLDNNDIDTFTVQVYNFHPVAYYHLLAEFAQRF